MIIPRVVKLDMFSVIIPNYNGERFLQECLVSLAESMRVYLRAGGKRGERKRVEIIVVDNGSTDGSREYLKKLKFKLKEIKNRKLKLKVIFNDQNLGFAKAVNQGIKEARNDYVVVMNNDLRLDKNWFAVMAGAINQWQKKEKVAAYFGTVLNWKGNQIESTGLEYWLKGKARNRDNGRRVSGVRFQVPGFGFQVSGSGFQVSGSGFRVSGVRFQRTKSQKPETRNLKPEFVFGASASVVVYYKPALIEVGLFDEDFFAYEEDVDLALRLHSAGWKTLYVPKAISYHLGGGTSSRLGNFRQRMDAKNWWFILIKNYPLGVLIRHSPEIFLERLRNLSGLLKVTPWWRWPIDLGRTYAEILLKLPRMVKKRRPLFFISSFGEYPAAPSAGMKTNKKQSGK